MAAISSEKQHPIITTMQSTTAPTNPSNLPCTTENDVEMGKSTLSPTIQPIKASRRKMSRSIVDDDTFVIDGTSEILPACSITQPSETKTEPQIISSSSPPDVPTTMTPRTRRRAIDELVDENIELSHRRANIDVS